MHPAQGRSWLCTISNFCRDGMLLVGNGGPGSLDATGADAKPGDTVALHFSVALPGGQKHFRTQARVARILGSGEGMGVHFPGGLPDDAYDTLMAFEAAGNPSGENSQPLDEDPPDDVESPQAPVAPQRISHEDADEIRRKMRRITQPTLDALCQKCFELIEEDLREKTLASLGDGLGEIYDSGRELIEKYRNQIRNDFIGGVLRQISNVAQLEDIAPLRSRREEAIRREHEQAGSDKFDGWLDVAEVVAKAESRYRDDLRDLRARLGLVEPPWRHKEVVPVGPAAITWAFDGALKDLELTPRIRTHVFEGFQAALLPALNDFYHGLGELLSECEIFPTEEALEAISALQEPARDDDLTLHEYVPGSARHGEASGDEPDAGEEAAVGVKLATHDEPEAEQVGPAPREVYATARSIVKLERVARQQLEGEGGEPRQAAGGGAANPFGSEEILRVLGALGPGGQGDRATVCQRLVQELDAADGDRSLGESDLDRFRVLESLIDSICEDRFLSQGSLNWVRRLEVTLYKLAVHNPGFPGGDPDRPHPAEIMLNQLARLSGIADSREAKARELSGRVDALVERVADGYSGDGGIFEEAVAELNPLVDEQIRNYRGNMERIVRASEGQQRLTRARKAVVNALAPKMAGKEVPEPILKLLNPGWRNLMVHTCLRMGAGSAQWEERVAVIERLWAEFVAEPEQGGRDASDLKQLLRQVADGLISISFDPGLRKPLLLDIAKVLRAKADGKPAPVKTVSVAADGVADALGIARLLPESDAELEAAQQEMQRSWAKSLSRARTLQAGDWIATDDAQGRPLILVVAFVGDESSGFVLANRNGRKERELTLTEMADNLHEARMTLLSDFDMPLVERAAERMLETVHGRLADQSGRDALTQLVNRREFERRLDKALKRSRADGVDHALMLIDLEGVEAVRSDTGDAGADELLKGAADVLTRALIGRPADIGRVDADRFGILLERTSGPAAMEIAEQILKALGDDPLRVSSGQQALSASIGLVSMDTQSESANAVMHYAERACRAARLSGRNQIKEFEIGEIAQLRRHGEAAWAFRLDEAMAGEGLIVSFRQIAPMSGARNGVDTHYEVQLTMRDEEGGIMAPEKFQDAAESHERMPALDRWTVAWCLDWMAAHKDSLDHFGGFAIRLSDRSLNEPTFSDFVLERFSACQVPTSKICFEITESVAVANIENAVEFMNRMKIIGCRFALEDFGSGRASYAYLRRLPVDYVKIDDVFVREIAANPGDYAVVRSINEIGHYMGKKTIAEFVEDEEVRARLAEIGVDYLQGMDAQSAIPLR